MPKKGANISLSSYDDIFSTEESRADQSAEKVQEIPLSELHPFKDHPFKVLDDEAMQKTVESIRQYGVMVPAIARPSPEGGYELIAGHRRHHAPELAGKETMPVIVREMDDDAATILMVDSNLQREELLPSERAFAYRMKLEAMKHQAGRPSKDNYSQVGNNIGKTSSEEMAGELGISKNQVFRFIRLTYLIPELLDMVDQKKLAFNPAVELSYLRPEEQKLFLEAMDYAQTTPSLSQAQRIKKYSQENKCTLDVMCAVMDEIKKDDMSKITISHDVIRKYFPKSYTPKQMEDTIIRLLEQWQKKRQREQER
ncbi:MAG: ParB/RepB/Spo0J family partition protein [Lachnospiraceae bacterium]|nr:ParB/RepB/Spo0J family partition protein [Lachnospiraceae bacterium]